MPIETEAVTTGRRTHHLDRRAGDIAAQGEGDPDDLLNTTALAKWLGVSTQWVEIGRHRDRFQRKSGWHPNEY